MVAGVMLSAIGGGLVGLGYSVFGGHGLGHALISYQMGGFAALVCFMTAITTASPNRA